MEPDAYKMDDFINVLLNFGSVQVEAAQARNLNRPNACLGSQAESLIGPSACYCPKDIPFWHPFVCQFTYFCCFLHSEYHFKVEM